MPIISRKWHWKDRTPVSFIPKIRIFGIIKRGCPSLRFKNHSFGTPSSSLININGSVYHPQMKSVFCRTYDEKLFSAIRRIFDSFQHLFDGIQLSFNVICLTFQSIQPGFQRIHISFAGIVGHSLRKNLKIGSAGTNK